MKKDTPDENNQYAAITLYFKDMNDIPDFRLEDDINKFKEFSSSVGELKQLMIENNLCYKNGKTYSPSEIQAMKLSELNKVKYRFVTHSEESNLKLRRDIVKQIDYCVSLRNAIIEPHLKLVISFAKKWVFSSRNNLSLSDLIQYGNEGLINAAETFDYARGTKFNTYAGCCVKQQIQNEIKKFSEIIVIPAGVQVETRFLKKKMTEFLEKNLREPNRTELFELSGLNEERFNNSYCVLNQQTYSLDVILDEDLSPINIIPDKKAQAALDSISECMFMEEKVRMHLSVLDERERKILEERYGFNDGIQKTLKQIAPEFGVSQEMIRLLERKALNKMRNAASQLYADR